MLFLRLALVAAHAQSVPLCFESCSRRVCMFLYQQFLASTSAACVSGRARMSPCAMRNLQCMVMKVLPAKFQGSAEPGNLKHHQNA